MLMKNKTREDNGFLFITSELIPVPCEKCGAESIINYCRLCKKTHYHGRVHTDGTLLALCDNCAGMED